MEVEDFKSAVLIEKINMMNIYEWGSKITVGEKNVSLIIHLLSTSPRAAAGHQMAYTCGLID